MKKRKSLVAKFVVSFLIIGILICGVTTVRGYDLYKSYIQKQYNNTAYEIAAVVEDYMTPMEIQGYLAMAEGYTKGTVTDEQVAQIKNSETYQRVEKLLYSLRERMNANDIFMVYIDHDIYASYDVTHSETWLPLTYVFDCYMEEDLKFDFGYRGKFNPVFVDSVSEIFETKERVDNYFISESEFGYNTSAIHPLVVDGEVKGIIGVEIPMSSLADALHEYITNAVIVTIILVVLFISLYIIYLYRTMLSPIHLIADEAENFVQNNAKISEKLGTVHTGDEIQGLSESILKMEIGIQEYIANLTRITAEKERIGAELNVAKQIQADMLPSIFPAFPEWKSFDIFATMTPAKEVGGDFYDFFMVDDDHLAFVIADVSGKGVPAALFMVITKTLLKNYAQQKDTPAEIFRKANNQLCENNQEGMFVTAWMGILQISTGKLTYVNAGHNPPLIKGADGTFRYLKCRPAFVLAGLEDISYQQDELQMQKGDSIYLYTDGVTESINVEEALYGEERLCTVLNQHAQDTPENILKAVKESMDAFVGKAEQFDDITMLCMTYVGKEKEEMQQDKTKLHLPAKIEHLDQVLDFVNAHLEAQNCEEKVKLELDIAVEELFVNVAMYAYQPAEGDITIQVSIERDTAEIAFIDTGKPYNPWERENPDTTLSAEERSIGGLGIYMVKMSMDEVAYAYENEQNITTIRKKIREDA